MDNYVGMSTCFICGEVKEILIDRKLRKILPQKACYSYEPCDKCKAYMKRGVILISVRDGEKGDNPYRTGKFCVITLKAAKRIFKTIPPKHVAFIEDTLWNQIGLPTKPKEGGKDV